MAGFEILDGKSPEEQEQILAESREAMQHILGTLETIGMRGFHSSSHPILTKQDGEAFSAIIRQSYEEISKMTPEEFEAYKKRTYDKIFGTD